MTDTKDADHTSVPNDEALLTDEPTHVEKPASPTPPRPTVPGGHTGTTLPPNKRHIAVIAHSAIDAVAIAALASLAITKVLDAKLAATIIAVIAGAWIGGQLRNGNGSDAAPGGGSMSLAMGLVQGLAGFFRKPK